MKSYLHFLFLVTLFGVTFLFLFSFSVCGFTHSLSFPCIFFCCIFLPGGCLLCILVDFLIWRATNTHAVRVRGLPLILFTFFLLFVFVFAFLLLFVVCMAVSCVWLVLGWALPLVCLSCWSGLVFAVSLGCFGSMMLCSLLSFSAL